MWGGGQLDAAPFQPCRAAPCVGSWLCWGCSRLCLCAQPRDPKNEQLLHSLSCPNPRPFSASIQLPKGLRRAKRTCRSRCLPFPLAFFSPLVLGERRLGVGSVLDPWWLQEPCEESWRELLQPGEGGWR